ncbi:hypothetical protein ACJMK2_040149 [Sinanodonta woodiana]|uniref:Uncharacterized protein n=1 Tax=Sinanodonta woodiana TaxID=1069815 RepID=A0ABD3WE45_SINWO
MSSPQEKAEFKAEVVSQKNPFTTIPPQPAEKKPGQLPPDKIRQFFDEGYTVVEEFFTAAELQQCRDAIAEMVDSLAQKLYDAGKIKHLYEEYGLFQRLSQLEEDFHGANIILFKRQKMPKAFQDIWCNERVLNLMEQLIGPDIAGHPVWNLRTKTPRSTAVDIPWHQDSAYFSEDSYDHLIPTMWLPFLDAVPENGCMQVAKNGHKSGNVAVHTCCKGPTWYVMLEEEEMQKTLGIDPEKDILTVPIKYGGFLLFNNLTPHRSLQNNSNDVRWSIDLRWQSPHDKWGFYDIAEGIVFRSSKDPYIKPDWDKFLSAQVEDPFDTTITGPWIGRWEIVNHNIHTEAFRNITGVVST